MRPFDLSLGTLLLRFYLMMALVILGVFTGQYWIAVLAFPVVLSALMGVRFTKRGEQE